MTQRPDWAVVTLCRCHRSSVGDDQAVFTETTADPRTRQAGMGQAVAYPSVCQPLPGPVLAS